jgi:CDP-diacylglycerol--glycerol-3-phosphate 3-phosphatidyltransferase
MYVNVRQGIVTTITSARIIGAAGIVYGIVSHHWWLALLITVIAFLSDYVDGWLARRWYVTSRFGAFFDPFADKVVTLTLIWLFVFHFHSAFYALVAIILSTYDVTTTTLRLMPITKRTITTSHIAKLKTTVLMLGLLCILARLMVTASYLQSMTGDIGNILLGIAALLSVISLKHYLRPSATHVEQHARLDDIDFGEWNRANGITCVLFDIEGTLVPWRSTKVSKSVRAIIDSANTAGVSHIGLVSNITPRNEAQAQAVTKQIGATYQLPRRRAQRKPSPYMIHAATRELGIPVAETAFVGDKLIDVIAAQRAGVKHIAWVEHLGTTDHPFDALVYRRVEPFIKWLMS